MNTNNSQAPNYSTNHEYVLVYAKHRPTAEQDKNMFREPKPGFEEVMELMERLNPDYPSIDAIEAELRALYDRHRADLRREFEDQGFEWKDEKKNDSWKGLYNYSRVEYRDREGKIVPEAEARTRRATTRVWQEADASMPATKQADSTRDPDHPNYRFYRPLHPVTGRACPHPKSGWKFAYRTDENSPDKRSFVSLDRDGRIAWGPDEAKVPRLKRMLHEVETNVGKSVFNDYSDGEKQTSALFGRSGVFFSPKHADFVSRFILHAAREDSTILDCFGGSGSTAHAVIKLNRSDRGRRKYVLVETADYFDAVLKPRILKAVYTVLTWDLRPAAKLEARVTGSGGAGLTVDFSRSISGRRPHYAWSAVTDGSGRLRLTLFGGATGLYQARAMATAGEAAASWSSLPINSHRVEYLDLGLGGSVAAGQPSAGKAAASGEPAESELYPNTPNPFNAGTQIAYRLADAGPVRLRIYNLLGQPVHTLVDEAQAAGVHRLSWDGRDLRGAPVAAGIYVVRLDHPGGVQTRRLMCLK